MIDAGLSGRRIENALRSINICAVDIDALFITHEHMDHIKGAGIFSRRFDIPIYATMGTWQGMAGIIGDIPERNRRYIYSGEPMVINDICLTPFDIPHDAKEPVGMAVRAGEKQITVATDIGHPTDVIRKYVSESDILLLESNYDIEMLEYGAYPRYLKRRIAGELGHLSNINAGELLAECMNGRIRHVVLGHLSEENNRPRLAFNTVAGILEKSRIIVERHLALSLAKRHEPSEMIEL